MPADEEPAREWDAPGMPELPEAERAREALVRHALGRVVADADDSDSYVCRPWPPGGLREALVGHRVTGIERVGKQLLVETDGPVLGLHLGMSGSLRFDGDPEPRFKRFSLAFTDGGTMVLRDPRRLGRVTLDPARGRLGPDALEVSLPRFRDLVGRSRASRRWPGWATCWPTRRCGGPGSTPAAAGSTSTPTSWPGSAARCGRRSGAPWPPAAPAAAPSPAHVPSGPVPVTGRRCPRPRSAAARPAGAPWTSIDRPPSGTAGVASSWIPAPERPHA
jgi:hypothetical protein